MRISSFISLSARAVVPAAVAVLLALPAATPIVQAASSVDYCSITNAQTKDSTYSGDAIKGIQSKIGVSQTGWWGTNTVDALCSYQKASCSSSPACPADTAIFTPVDLGSESGQMPTVTIDEATLQQMTKAHNIGVNNGPCTGKTGQDLLRCHLVEPSKGDAARYEGKDETSLVRFVIGLVTGLMGTIALIFIFLNVFRLMTADGDEGAFSQAIRSIAFGAVGMILAGAAYAIMGAIIDIDILP